MSFIVPFCPVVFNLTVRASRTSFTVVCGAGQISKAITNYVLLTLVSLHLVLKGTKFVSTLTIISALKVQVYDLQSNEWNIEL